MLVTIGSFIYLYSSLKRKMRRLLITTAALLGMFFLDIQTAHQKTDDQQRFEKAAKPFVDYIQARSKDGLTIHGVTNHYAERQFESGVTYAMHLRLDSHHNVLGLEVLVRKGKVHRWVKMESDLRSPTGFMADSQKAHPYAYRRTQIPPLFALEILAGYLPQNP